MDVVGVGHSASPKVVVNLGDEEGISRRVDGAVGKGRSPACSHRVPNGLSALTPLAEAPDGVIAVLSDTTHLPWCRRHRSPDWTKQPARSPPRRSRRSCRGRRILGSLFLGRLDFLRQIFCLLTSCGGKLVGSRGDGISTSTLGAIVVVVVVGVGVLIIGPEGIKSSAQ